MRPRLDTTVRLIRLVGDAKQALAAMDEGLNEALILALRGDEKAAARRLRDIGVHGSAYVGAKTGLLAMMGARAPYDQKAAAAKRARTREARGGVSKADVATLAKAAFKETGRRTRTRTT